jgi:hypothetical protein
MNDNEIEFINALAPFDHGEWQGNTSSGTKICLGNKSLFKTRSDWIVNKIVSYLLNQFSKEDLISMSVLEVGSYDGWVLTQICKHIKFFKVIGLEPRLKNIKKGEMGRKLSGVDTQAKFIKGSSDELDKLFPNQKFDIVISLGMLHHVSSTYDTIKSISSKSSGICIIDSMIIPALDNDIKKIEPYVNTRDIIYHQEDSLWTIAAYKYESPYGDGSRNDYGIVNIPSANLIEMSLRACGFGALEKLGSELDFYDETAQTIHGLKELLCVSKRQISLEAIDNKWRNKVKNSENIFCHTVLPEQIILSLTNSLSNYEKLELYDDVVKASKAKINLEIKKSIEELLIKGLDKNTKNIFSKNIPECTEEHFYIMGVLFRSPFEKIILETAKFFLNKEILELSIKYLKIIVRKPGCDWWSFYRSCYLLRESYKKLKDDVRSNHYKELLLLSNENFPF